MFTSWHYEIDSLPRLKTVSSNQNSIDIHLPVGIWTDTNEPFNVLFEVWINNDPSFRIGFDDSNPLGFVRRITENWIALVRSQDSKEARFYIEMEGKLQTTNNSYYEAQLKNIPQNAKVRYEIKILPRNQSSRVMGPYTLYAVNPTFDYDSIYAISDGNGNIDAAYALYYTQDAYFHHLRVDLVEIVSTRLDFQLEVHQQYYNMSNSSFQPELLPSLPCISFLFDYVTIAIPKSEMAIVKSIKWRGKEYDIQSKVTVGRARLMFIHYCMQGLNDLFELPNKSYNPPRTFIQTTMRDEKATYSSRPNSDEGTVGDGYLYTLDSHRKSNVPYLWTFNGGVLGLIAHDCPNDIVQIKNDIAAGILDPTIAGFGGHRLPYYQEETNLYAIQYGIDMVKNILGTCNNVYYLDQRLYKKIPNVINALKKADNVTYLVVDGSTGFYPYRDTTMPNSNAQKAYLDEQYLWQDRSSNFYLLFINDELREKIMGSSKWEWKRGKLTKDLRRKLIYFAANPVVRRNNLMVYSDDADKASGNGWFDGKYSGYEIEYKEKFDAALEWISEHPWIHSIISNQLDPQTECVGTIDMQTAICPSVDPGGASTWDMYGKQIHFDAWYDNWKNFRSLWLDQSMEEISQSVEYAIIDWPMQFRNRLYQLGQMNFAMFLHESQWNKQPLESIWGLNSNQRMDVSEPEDFVITATMQLRNAQVYLNASVWAQWAVNTRDTAVYINAGPVINQIQSITYANYNWRDGLYRNRNIVKDPLKWDRDLQQNVVIYNKDILVVMDCNGGRVTHLFSMRDGIPLCLSGTFKCYQFLSGEKIYGENITCDGEVLQNTVYTPNHSYIACDVLQSRGTIGKKYNPKTLIERDLDCFYPDNFNSYKVGRISADSVEWVYEQTDPVPQFNLGYYRALSVQDRDDKLQNRRGVVFHPFPSFSKQISVTGRTITVQYKGVQPGHIVANEFCIDLNDSIMYAKRNLRRHISTSKIVLSNIEGVSVEMELGNNCSFTADTLQGDQNLRLHRVMTDTLELTAENGGDFSYQIHIG